MANSQSTQKPSADKPAKPYPEYPLYAHASGQWAKKIRQKTHFFGKWSDWRAALEKYLEEIDDLKAGRTPRRRQTGATIRDVLNRFDAHKESLRDSGEITEEWLRELRRVTDLLAEHFDKHRLVDDLRPEDFEGLRAVMAKRWGPARLSNGIQQVRSVFLYAYDAGDIDKPVRFGPGFKKPSQRVQRVQKKKRGRRDFPDPKEVLRLLRASDMRLKCWILLGLNAGFGQTDCVTLPMHALDLENGWLDYHRQKTGIDRRIPLWPETVKRLRAYLRLRPEPKTDDDAAIVFLAARGHAIERRNVDKAWRVLDTTHTFYDLRRTFETKGEEVSETATKAIMGHAAKTNDMSAVYRQVVSDERLLSVTNSIRAWLFGEK